MKPAEKNHLWERILFSRDENQWGRIILERGFCSVGMKLAEQNHLWERIFIGRDEISGAESSLRENFYPQG